MSIKDRDYMKSPEDAKPDAPAFTLAECSAFYHELFTAHVAAGFTEEQAMRMLIAVISRPSA